jgi:hypothetical protein
MRVLVACEFSGIVRDAFRARGHDAASCDFEPCERPGPHYQGNVLDILELGWDLLIGHPPCRFLAVSGAHLFSRPERIRPQLDALHFARQLMYAPIEKIAIENPISILSTRVRKPEQIIQPWMFGHGEIKTTCLWLKNLPPLVPTCVVPESERWAPTIKRSPGPERQKDRSRTYEGVALAMAAQWG